MEFSTEVTKEYVELTFTASYLSQSVKFNKLSMIGLAKIQECLKTGLMEAVFADHELELVAHPLIGNDPYVRFGQVQIPIQDREVLIPLLEILTKDAMKFWAISGWHEVSRSDAPRYAVESNSLVRIVQLGASSPSTKLTLTKDQAKILLKWLETGLINLEDDEVWTEEMLHTSRTGYTDEYYVLILDRDQKQRFAFGDSIIPDLAVGLGKVLDVPVDKNHLISIYSYLGTKSSLYEKEEAKKEEAKDDEIEEVDPVLVAKVIAAMKKV